MSKNLKIAVEFILNNSNDINCVLYCESRIAYSGRQIKSISKWKVFGCYDFDFLTEQSALKIAEKLNMVSLPGYKHAGNLSIGSTMYVLPQNQFKY